MINYSKKYIDFINLKECEVGHAHHVIPRCCGGTDGTSRIAVLSYEDHVMAHQILAEDNPDHVGLNYAFNRMRGMTEEAHRIACSAGGKASLGSGNYNWIQVLGGKSSVPTIEVHIAGGKAQGKRNVESGQLASVRPEKTVEFQKNASKRASRPVYALEDPSIRSSWNQKKATEKRLGKSFTWVDV